MPAITVKALSRYGFQSITGEWLNWDKEIPESQKGLVVPGATLMMEVFQNESGKRYVKAVGEKTEPVAEVIKPFTPPVAKAVTPETNQKTDWAAKDRSQLIGGLSHDAVSLVNSLIRVRGDIDTAEKMLVVYKQFLEGLIQVRSEVK